MLCVSQSVSQLVSSNVESDDLNDPIDPNGLNDLNDPNDPNDWMTESFADN